jgi:hypothetical protein
LANATFAAVEDETYDIGEVKVEGFPKVSNPFLARGSLAGTTLSQGTIRVQPTLHIAALQHSKSLM